MKTARRWTRAPVFLYETREPARIFVQTPQRHGNRHPLLFSQNTHRNARLSGDNCTRFPHNRQEAVQVFRLKKGFFVETYKYKIAFLLIFHKFQNAPPSLKIGENFHEKSLSLSHYFHLFRTKWCSKAKGRNRRRLFLNFIIYTYLIHMGFIIF